VVDLEGSALMMPKLPSLINSPEHRSAALVRMPGRAMASSSRRSSHDSRAVRSLPSSKTEPLCGFVGVGGDSFAENSAKSQEFSA